jgi:hypothetical protein
MTTMAILKKGVCGDERKRLPTKAMAKTAVRAVITGMPIMVVVDDIIDVGENIVHAKNGTSAAAMPEVMLPAPRNLGSVEYGGIVKDRFG